MIVRFNGYPEDLIGLWLSHPAGQRKVQFVFPDKYSLQ